MKNALALLSLAVLLLEGAGVRGDFVTYSIQDIGSFSGQFDGNTSDTFSGTGFVGLYNPAYGLGFGHLLGLESNNAGMSQSRTALQVDVSGLVGKVISDVTLSFTLQSGSGEAQQMTLTAFTANGALGYYFNPPNPIASETVTVYGQSVNSIDVTNLLTQSLASGNTWFGLVLNGSSQDEYTSTLYDPNAANMTLSVDPTAVTPEPASISMVVTGGACLAGYFWRKRRTGIAQRNNTSV